MSWYYRDMKKFIRKIIKAGSHSYTITIPKELMKKFKWRERQKIEIVFGGKKHRFSIKD